ncbi:MAG: PIN domain-containing protein [Ferrimicrobium sp.]
MILFETHVISEPLRRNPSPEMIHWLDDQPLETLYIAAITVAELCYGAAVMPAGRRRDYLQDRLNQEILPIFSGCVLPFDVMASRIYGDVMARARSAGLAIAVADGYIAAIAAAHGLVVVTRDVSPFRAAGLEVIDPWSP